MAKLTKKTESKEYPFYEVKSFVGLTPDWFLWTTNQH